MRRLWLALCAVLILTACDRERLWQQEAFVFGTRVELSVWGADADAAQAAMNAVLREFDRLHGAYHAWQPSELTALNAALARGEAAEVSAELAALLADAKALAALGDNSFNPAIGQLIALWGFHGEHFPARLPDPAALRAVLARAPDMAALHIDGRVVRSDNPAVQLDLGAYAKGYALDRAAALLRAGGIANALINIGGNVMALGSKGGQAWQVGIQHPRAPQPLAALSLYDGEAVATSGDYQRYFEVDGQRYSHLLDPRRGMPAQASQAVTVLVTARPDAGVRSDVASTPLFIAGDAWPAMARRYAVDAVLRVDAAGRISVTRAMSARLRLLGDTVVEIRAD